MFVNSPNQPLEFAMLRLEAAAADLERDPARRLNRPSRRRFVRPNIVRLIPGATRLPLGSQGQPA
jgi:hypothetical protein